MGFDFVNHSNHSLHGAAWITPVISEYDSSLSQSSDAHHKHRKENTHWLDTRSQTPSREVATRQLSSHINCYYRDISSIWAGKHGVKTLHRTHPVHTDSETRRTVSDRAHSHQFYSFKQLSRFSSVLSNGFINEWWFCLTLICCIFLDKDIFPLSESHHGLIKVKRIN